MYRETLRGFGLAMPEILLPASGIDQKKWAVIACDQFTQDAEYWEAARAVVGDAPSTLHLIFPEIYLEKPGKRERIERIHGVMRTYLEQGVFAPPVETFIYVERTTPFAAPFDVRRGLVTSIDLEQYEWRHSEKSLIRTTEGTAPDRLPPRMDVRRGAPLESPHVLLLINDKADALLPALGERAKATLPLYHTDLMLDSGAITGWAVNTEKDVSFLVQNLETLASSGLNGREDEKPFLFAVGDGNHSLAAAKAVWEEYKASHAGERGLERHPARYAMVEIENLYDDAVHFAAIHRVVFGDHVNGLLETLSTLPDAVVTRIGGGKELSTLTIAFSGKNRLGLILDNDFYLVEFADCGLAVALLQPLLDDFVKETGSSIDYIHGEDAVFHALQRSDRRGAGILLPPVQKSGFFETMSHFGALPRKSFSMGEALEKRFYFECRRIEA
ncbi:MAG: DUF1015 domain-containing protein [Treponema sp.]|jgi:hypothetical protein|nr:DUF1015 domain-containing protein [Treponema sp.]